MANTFRKIYKKTGSSGTSSDYQLVGNVGVNGVELDIMKGATSEADGEIGLVPKPTINERGKVLCGDGTWIGINDLLKDSVMMKYEEYPIAQFQVFQSLEIVSNYSRAYKYGCIVFMKLRFKTPSWFDTSLRVIQLPEGIYPITSYYPLITKLWSADQPMTMCSIDEQGRIFLTEYCEKSCDYYLNLTYFTIQ